MAGLRLTGALLVVTAIGAAGGYTAGELTAPGAPRSTGTDASPLAMVDTPSPVQVKTPLPDRTEALAPDKLEYRTKTFTAERAVRSRVSVKVPKNWVFTQPEEDEGRYTDPMHKRWIRVEAGFTPLRSTAASMAQRINELKSVDPTQDLTIVSQQFGSTGHADGTPLTYWTLVYTYIPQDVKRYVMVRWISFGQPDLTRVEMSVTGLPQDQKALYALLNRATETVVRTDIRGGN